MASALRQSEHLHIIERPGRSHVAYHKLFGNLSFLNDSALALLQSFEETRAETAASEAVQRFHDLYFLVSEGEDEREELASDLERRSGEARDGTYLGGLQLCVSETCNFQCRYCFCDATDARGEKRLELARSASRLMSFETAVRVIDTLIAHVRRTGRNALSVKFFGREPLINWRVIRQVLEHYGDGRDSAVLLQYAITTNGSLLTHEIAAELAAFGVHTSVSIDELEDTASANRLTKGGRPTAMLARRGIEILAAHRPVDTISVVLTPENFDRFGPELVDFARASGAAELQVQLAMQGEFIRKLDPDDVAAKLAELYACGRSAGVGVSGYWYNSVPMLFHTRKLRSDARIVRGAGNSCSATGHQISVDPSGDIFPCRATSTHLGHIDALDEMLRSGTYRSLVMRTYNNVEDCRGCEIEGFCQGECPGNSEKKMGDFYKIDHSYCDIYKGIHRRLLDLF